MKRDFANASGPVGLRRVTDYPDFARGAADHEVGTRLRSGTVVGPDLATFRREIDDPLFVHPSDAEMLADFSDFMQGETAFEDGRLAPPDPAFRERLRRRLWRTQVHASLRDSRETH